MYRLFAMGTKFWILFFSILVTWSEAKNRFKRQISEQQNNIEKYKELVLNIQEVNKTQFLEQDVDKGEYQFGYHITNEGSFHHENRAPDGITYGCYGYIDAYGIPVEYYYVSDGWGYRTVLPNNPVEIFYHPHDTESHSHHHEEENSLNDNEHHGNGHANGHEHHHEHHGKIVQWNELHFPKQCENKDFTILPSSFGHPSQNPSKPFQPESFRPSTRPPQTISQISTFPETGRPLSEKPTPIKPQQTNTSYPEQSVPISPGLFSSQKPQPGISVKPESFPEFTAKPNEQIQQISTLSSQTALILPTQPSIPEIIYPQEPQTGLPQSSGSQGSQFPQRPQPGLPDLTPTSFPGQPGQPSTPFPGQPSQPSTLYPGQPGRPSTSFPGQPSQPSTSYSGQPGQPSTSFPGQPSQPSTLYPGQPGRPSTSFPGQPSQPSTSYSGQPSQPSTFYPEQPSRPELSGGQGSQFPQRPQPGLPGLPPTSFPGQPGQPSTSFPGQPSQPSTTYPGQPGRPSTSFPGQPSQPSTFYPGQPGRPSTSFPGQPSQPFTLYPGQPGRPSTSFPVQPSQPSTLYPGQPGRPSTSFPGQPSQPSTLYPGQPGQPSTSFPGQPSQPPTLYPGQPGRPSTSFPGQPSQPSTLYPGQPGQPSTSFPGQPSQPSTLYPGQPGRPSTSFPGQPSQPSTSYSGQPSQPSTFYPERPSRPELSGGQGSQFPQRPHPGLPGLPPTSFPGQPGQPSTSFPGQPSRPSTSYPSKPGRPESSESHFPQYPGLLEQSTTSYQGEIITNFSGQSLPSLPSQPPLIGNQYPQPGKPEQSTITHTGQKPVQLLPTSSSISGGNGTPFSQSSQPGVPDVSYISTSTSQTIFSEGKKPIHTSPSYPEIPGSDISHPNSTISSFFPSQSFPARPGTSISPQIAEQGNQEHLLPTKKPIGIEYPESPEYLDKPLPNASEQPKPSVSEKPVTTDIEFRPKPVSEITGQSPITISGKPITQVTSFTQKPSTGFQEQPLVSIRPEAHYPQKPESGKPNITYSGQSVITDNGNTQSLKPGYTYSTSTGGINLQETDFSHTLRPGLSESTSTTNMHKPSNINFGLINSPFSGRPTSTEYSILVTQTSPQKPGTFGYESTTHREFGFSHPIETSPTLSEKPEYPDKEFTDKTDSNYQRPSSGIFTGSSATYTEKPSSTLTGELKPSTSSSAVGDRIPSCGGPQKPPCPPSGSEGENVSTSCSCSPNDVTCILACSSSKQPPKEPIEASTYRPGFPNKPTDIFCNCSPFDIECTKKCSEIMTCDETSGDCKLPLENENVPKPSYPTYPPPACGGIGQEDCPYPPAGMKPFPEFTYPPTGDNLNLGSPSFPSKPQQPGTDLENLQLLTNEQTTPTSLKPTFGSSGKPDCGTGINELLCETTEFKSKPTPSYSYKPSDKPAQKPEKPFSGISETENQKPYRPNEYSKPGLEAVKPGKPTQVPLSELEVLQELPTNSDLGKPGGIQEKPTGFEQGSILISGTHQPDLQEKPEEEFELPNQFNSRPESHNVAQKPSSQDLNKPQNEKPPYIVQQIKEPAVFENSGLTQSTSKEPDSSSNKKPGYSPANESGNSGFSGLGQSQGVSFQPQYPDSQFQISTSKYSQQSISGASNLFSCNSTGNCGPEKLPPTYIIPYPIPIVPSPGNCPCYLVSPENETITTKPTVQIPTSTSSSINYSQNLLPQGIIGYIPVVFYPYCPGNNSNFKEIQPFFPQAYPVPYPCQQCQNKRFKLAISQEDEDQFSKEIRFTDPNLYPSIAFPDFIEKNKIISRQGKNRRKVRGRHIDQLPANSFEQILKQGNIQFQQIIKSPHRSAFGEKINPSVRIH